MLNCAICSESNVKSKQLVWQNSLKNPHKKNR